MHADLVPSSSFLFVPSSNFSYESGFMYSVDLLFEGRHGMEEDDEGRKRWLVAGHCTIRRSIFFLKICPLFPSQSNILLVNVPDKLENMRVLQFVDYVLSITCKN